MTSLIFYGRAEAAPSVAPVLPAQAEYVHEVGNRVSIYLLGRERDQRHIACIMLARDPSFPLRALYAFTGPDAMIAALQARIDADSIAFTRTWPTLGAFRLDATALCDRLRSAWPDDRPLDEQGQPVGARYAVRVLMARRNGNDPSETDEDGES